MPCNLEYICISLILGNIISEVLSFLYIYILYLKDRNQIEKNNRITTDKKLSTTYQKRLLKITIPVGLTSFVRSGLSTIKQVLIPIGLEKYGHSYAQALSSYGLITGMALPAVLFPNIVIIAFSNLLIPEFSEFNTRHESARIYINTRKILKYSLYFSILISIFMWIFSEELSLAIYKTNSVSFYIKILAPIIPFMYIDSVVDAILRGLNKHVEVLKINIIDLITSIFLIITLIPKIGIQGYICTIAYSEILNFVLSYLTLRKAIKN